MLQNAHLLAKIGADTAENERQFAESLPSLPGAAGALGRGDPREDRPADGRAGRRAARSSGCQASADLRGENEQNLQNFANFWRARSRLYQNEFLQENMRLTAFVKIYKMCTLFCTVAISKF